MIDCILWSPADSDAFQNERCAEHNVCPELSIYYSQLVSGVDHYDVVFHCPFRYCVGGYFVIASSSEANTVTVSRV